MSKVVKVMPRILWPLFPDTVYVYTYTFFGGTPTGQTPQRIFTRDGSNDAVSGKGAFGGLEN